MSSARRVVVEWATRISLNVVNRTKFSTAASEIGRNQLVHGRGGTMVITQLQQDGIDGLELVFQDHGPGIADPEQAMVDGFSTARSMGLGLGGARRLVNEFKLETELGQGCKVTLVQWKRR